MKVYDSQFHVNAGNKSYAPILYKENYLSVSIKTLVFDFSEPVIQRKHGHVVRKVLLVGKLLVLYQ